MNKGSRAGSDLKCTLMLAFDVGSMVSPGGRIKRRALRGIVSQLAGRNGLGGFFQSSQAAVRTLGELVAKNAVDDPQLVDDPQDRLVVVGWMVGEVSSVGTDFFSWTPRIALRR